MAWRFPSYPFDVITATCEYINCSLVEADTDNLTIDRDYVMVLGRLVRLRTQVRIEDIRAIHEHAVQCDHTEVPDSLLAPHRESRHPDHPDAPAEMG